MSDVLEFTILGIPQPKQSARFRVAKFGGKSAVVSYQSKKVKDAERNIAYDIKSQLPEGFTPINGPVHAEVTFFFPPLKGWSKKKLQALSDGAHIYKDTKPDLTDNLMKGLFDAMQGIVFIDDSRVASVISQKLYSEVPRTEITIYELGG